jgi:hypothetical protein
MHAESHELVVEPVRSPGVTEPGAGGPVVDHPEDQFRPAADAVTRVGAEKSRSLLLVVIPRNGVEGLFGFPADVGIRRAVLQFPAHQGLREVRPPVHGQ